jgi:hypothetical protein
MANSVLLVQIFCSFKKKEEIAPTTSKKKRKEKKTARTGNYLPWKKKRVND